MIRSVSRLKLNGFCEYDSDYLTGDSINDLDNLCGRLHVDQEIECETRFSLKHCQRKRKLPSAPDNETLSKRVKLPKAELGANFTCSDCDQSFPNETKRDFHIKV